MGDLDVGRADPVHDLDHEAVGVDRPARGEHDGRGGRAAQQQDQPERDPLQDVQRMQQRVHAFAMRDDSGFGRALAESAARQRRGRAGLDVEIDQRRHRQLGALGGGAEPAGQRPAHLAFRHRIDGGDAGRATARPCAGLRYRCRRPEARPSSAPGSRRSESPRYWRARARWRR